MVWDDDDDDDDDDDAAKRIPISRCLSHKAFRIRCVVICRRRDMPYYIISHRLDT